MMNLWGKRRTIAKDEAKAGSELETWTPSPGNVTTFEVTQVPGFAPQFMKRIEDKDFDTCSGDSFKIVGFHLTQDDRDRWPQYFRSSRKLTMVFGSRSGGKK